MIGKKGLGALCPQNSGQRYPFWGMLAVMGLIYLSPFLYSLPSYLAFVLCVYRVVKYDSRIFVTDYCVLISVSTIFRTSWGMALLVYLCLFAAVWYLVRGGIRASASYVLLIVVLNYLVTRMQMNITAFLLCFGPMALLCVVLPKQDVESAERTAKMYCMSMIVSSFYALVLRGMPHIRAICGAEVPVFLGSSLRRFQGLFPDPNYFMYLLVVGLALLVKLKETDRITAPAFWTMAGCLAGFGILTYSKTFFLVLMLLGVVYVVWQFWNRKILRGSALTLVGICAVTVLLLADFSPFSVVLKRLTSANSLSDLTTGRSDVFMAYLDVIISSVPSCLFGQGMAAESLFKAPHNLYLEVVYYIGLVGLVLMIAYFAVIIAEQIKRTRRVEKQNIWAKYAVLLMVLVIHMVLHGMFTVITYGGFLLAFLSIMLTKKKEAK